MRLYLICKECVAEAKAEEKGDFSRALNPALYTRQSFYEFTCRSGHTNTIILKEQLFEVLFEMAAVAYVEDYYRDAVATAAAALERFYEFVIKLLLRNKNVNEESIEKLWKQVSKQSERQLGAYLFLFLSELSVEPISLLSDEAGFRNTVIHQGHIPTKKEAFEFLLSIYSIIKDILLILYDHKMKDSIEHSIKLHEKTTMKEAGEREFTHMSTATIVRLWNYSEDHYDTPLVDHLDALKEKQKGIFFTALRNEAIAKE